MSPRIPIWINLLMTCPVLSPLPSSACSLHVIHVFRMWVGSLSRIAAVAKLKLRKAHLFVVWVATMLLATCGNGNLLFFLLFFPPRVVVFLSPRDQYLRIIKQCLMSLVCHEECDCGAVFLYNSIAFVDPLRLFFLMMRAHIVGLIQVLHTLHCSRYIERP